MLKIKKHKRVKNRRSILLLFMFLFSCVLQVSVTLKFAELIHNGTSSKVTKGVVYELPDTPENPEKNNCDCFEEDNENESVKIEGFENCYCFSLTLKSHLKSQTAKICNFNSIVLSKNSRIYLSIRNLRI